MDEQGRGKAGRIDQRMKKVTAIPYENGQVFGHFGKTQAFLIAELETGKILRSAVVPTEGKGHGELAGFLKAHGVTDCLCGGMGETVLQNYAQGSLQDDPQAACSHHHDHQAGHSCSCGKHS